MMISVFCDVQARS